MTNAVDELAQRLGTHWPNIAGARLAAANKLAEYSDALRDSWSPDAAIVFYGSLARHEWTSGSDVDWTPLVDGPAVPDRMRAVREIRDQLAKVEAKAPGSCCWSRLRSQIWSSAKETKRSFTGESYALFWIAIWKRATAHGLMACRAFC